MADLGEELTKWYKNIEQLAQLDIKERRQMTEAGAEVFAKELERATPVSNNDSDHAKDSIIVQDKNIDGQIDGNSTVGYDSDHGYIMRFMNDGTKYYPKNKNHLGFYNKVIENESVKRRVLEAEAQEFDKVLVKKNSKGG